MSLLCLSRKKIGRKTAPGDEVFANHSARNIGGCIADSLWASATQGALVDDDDEDPLLKQPLANDRDIVPLDTDLETLTETPASALTQEYTQATTLSSLHPHPRPRSTSISHPSRAPAAKSSASKSSRTISKQHVPEEEEKGVFFQKDQNKEQEDFGAESKSAEVETRLFEGLEKQGSTGRRFEEILRWFPKRTMMEREAQRQDALLRRLSFQAHDILALPRTFAGVLA